MPAYDPQRNRRRPSAAESGAAPVDGLLGGVESEAAEAAPSTAREPELSAAE